MTDRELLVLAAKAAEVDGWWEQPYLSFIKREGGIWDPLGDDADAFRLAVKLGMCIGPNFDDDRVVVDQGLIGRVHITEKFGVDRCETTRRAIVQAAAEVGRGMK